MPQQIGKKKFANWKETIITSAVILLCLILVYFFPTEGPFQTFSRNLFFLAIIPALYIIFILKRRLSDFGLNFSATKENGYWFLGTLLLSLLVSFVLIKFTSFKGSYTLSDYAIENFGWFLVYELIFVNFWLFFNEAFYRGFVFFAFAEKYKYWSILISTFLFTLFLFLTKTLSWNMSPYLIISLTGGWLAFKTRSFVYSYLMGLLFIMILDGYIIYTLKQSF